MTEDNRQHFFVAPVLTLDVRGEADVVVACQRVRQLGQMLGLSSRDQTRASSAVSEVVGEALAGGGALHVELGVGAGRPPRPLRVRVVSRSSQFPDQQVLSDVEPLVDDLQAVDGERSGAVVLDLTLGGPAPSAPELEALGDRLTDMEPSPLEEVQHQNQRLLQVMDEVHQGQQEQTRLTRELDQADLQQQKLNLALEARARQWQATFDAIGDALCVLDGEGRLIQANHSMNAMMGLSGDPAGCSWPETIPLDLGSDDPLRVVQQTGRRASSNVEHGGRWYRVQVDPLAEPGAPPQYVVLVADVTDERRAVEQIVQSEGKLRAIFDHSAVGLWLVPVEQGHAGHGWPAEGSPALERFWGYCAAELGNLSMAQLCHAEDLDADASLRQQLLDGKLASYQTEKRFVHRDGSELWGDLAVSLIRDPGGEPAYLVYTIVDITRRKQAEQGLTRINEALKAYAHTVSHDLKGPLSGAIAAAQVLGRMLDQPQTEMSTADLRELAGVFSGSVGRTVDLINNLLALAEAEQGPSMVSAVDVNQVLAEVLEDRAGVITGGGVAVEAAPDLGQLMAAPPHVYQLLANLVDNALKHGRGDPPRIWISRLPSDEQGELRLQVRDNGPGIAETLKETLFEEFVRGAGGGSGIGLATVRKIAEAYGGAVSVRNRQGACFEIVLFDQG